MVIVLLNQANKPTTLRLGKEGRIRSSSQVGFQYQKVVCKGAGLCTKVGTYASALFLLKDTFKEHVDDPQVFEKEFLKYLKENGYELDDTIAEEVTLEDGKLPKGIYKQQDIAFDEEDADTPDALEGDEIQAFEQRTN